jgi:uncharacterized protein YehS (DUF1456 family)
VPGVIVTNNDIIRRVRYALHISDPAMIAIFSLSGHVIEPSVLDGLLKKEDEAGYLDCSDILMVLFLDGLIIQKRGMKASATGSSSKTDAPLTNNAILKKLRIALEFREDDMIAVMKLVDIVISKSELSALFRNKEHKNYKVCGDQFLRNFLKGLTIRNRNLPSAFQLTHSG